MMKDSKRIGFTKWELLVVVLINVVLIALLVPAVQQARGPAGPHGKKIPDSAPQEENRINHPSGLSIIAPPNWKNRWEMVTEAPEICINPHGSMRRRDHSQILIWRNQSLPEKDELPSFKHIEFQGFSAYEKMEIKREDSFDDPAHSVYELYIDRDGVVWNIVFSVSEEITHLPAIMRKYIDTIRFPPKVDAEKNTEAEPNVND